MKYFVILLALLGSMAFGEFGLAQEHLSGVILMVHGLNTKPEKMQSLAQAFEENNYKVFLTVLSGHSNEDLAIVGQITRTKWLSDLDGKYQEARHFADSRKVPLIFVGYSLGGLLGVDLLTDPNYQIGDQAIHWDKMVLLAPAIATQGMVNSFGLLRGLMPGGFVVPSMSPYDYRANPAGTSVAEYNALFQSQHEVQTRDPGQLNEIPTLIFIDPQDELVSESGLQNFMTIKGLENWKLIEVQKDPETRKMYHHLLIDPETLGAKSFSNMKKYILEFVMGDRF
jgi:pimeloyl-ACP methyl ester carboxylesterase